MEQTEQLSVSQQNRNIVLLAAAQALSGANGVVFYATGAIVGDALAPDKSWATLPISLFVAGMAVAILPLGALARRAGRKVVFIVGTAAGVLTGLLAALAVVQGAFWLFCLAALCGGAYSAVTLSFRFAATDGVDPARRARALSLVMGGGVAAGVIGPMLVSGTAAMLPAHLFAATFCAQAAVAALAALVLLNVKTLPAPPRQASGGRPLAAIVRQPGFARTVFCGAVTYMVMNFLMTAAPLAMHMHGLSQHAANLGIQWHVIAMYGPGFFTGRLIQRFGAARVSAAGLAITGLSAVAGLAGSDVMHYWGALVLLGLGWNLGFTGASARIIDFHRPEEKTRVQSLNDFIVFGVMIVGSFCSGALLNAFGWHAVLWGALIPVTAAFIIMVSEKRQAAPAEAA